MFLDPTIKVDRRSQQALPTCQPFFLFLIWCYSFSIVLTADMSLRCLVIKKKKEATYVCVFVEQLVISSTAHQRMRLLGTT